MNDTPTAEANRSSGELSKVEADRRILSEAQAKGTGATLGAFVRLSGPGWLQSAITLGGGSLTGALFLGALGGVNMLWLQLMAIIMGVIMLSAISYVTLSTGERPFQAINTHINPALGWGWLIATSMANMIWCMPQFALCYTTLNKNLLPGVVGDSDAWKWGASGVILALVTVVVIMNSRRGLAAKLFDWILKGLVGMVVICFFGVVAYLASQGVLDWSAIFAGFVPDLNQWTQPTGEVAKLVAGLPDPQVQSYWSNLIVSNQRNTMIAAAATAVGINMTFLMPYSMLHRGWNKTFRGLARFDLATGMAIPYIIVTSCVVIASAHAFNAQTDEQLKSTDVAEFQSSPSFGGTKDALFARVAPDMQELGFDKAKDTLPESEFNALLTRMAELPEAEKAIASSMVKRNASQLSQSLSPLFGEGAKGEQISNTIFGLGVFGMGFSTIIILMLINGFVFCEVTGRPESSGAYAAGCLVAGLVGAAWPFVWAGESQFWLAIIASTFGGMLLPIAYITFMMMMNSKSILGEDKPRGASLITWNVLMAFAVVGAIAAAATAIYDKVTAADPLAGWIVICVLSTYLVLVAIGFVFKPKPRTSP
jgi:Mn2+/Fe2+ NRAMP family transporter